MSRLAAFLNESIWLLTDERFATILNAIEAIEAGTYSYDHTARKPDAAPMLVLEDTLERVAYAEPRGQSEQRAVLIVPFQGTIYPRAGMTEPMSGGVNLQETLGIIRRAIADPGVSSIIGDFDSPGGMVSGVPEAAAELRTLRGLKPMTAVANFQAASAAYYLAAQFDEIVASPSASVGSIGVIAQYMSAAKRIKDMGYEVQTLRYPDKKAEADGVNPLSEEAYAYRMTQIRKAYDDFEANVAAGRRIDQTVVAEKFGQGRSIDAQDARKIGMIDRIGTFDSVISEHVTGRVGKAKAYKASREEKGMTDEPIETPAPAAPAPPERTMTADELAQRWGIEK